MADEQERGAGESNDCGKCQNEVRSAQDGLFCDFCKVWFHSKCQKINKEAYKKISEAGKQSLWFCASCKHTFEQLSEENGKLKLENKVLRQCMDELRRENAELRARLQTVENTNIELEAKVKALQDDYIDLKESHRTLEQSNNELKTKLKTVEDTVNKMQATMAKQIKEQVTNDLTEQFEREKKKNNIIIYNLVEPTQRDSKARKDRDMAVCVNLCNEELQTEEVTVVETIRLGKPRTEVGARPRPLLVRLTNPREKWHVLKQARLLRNTRTEHLRQISIAPDMTPMQREADKELRRQLKEKRDAGEEGWYIQHNTLKRRTNF